MNKLDHLYFGEQGIIDNPRHDANLIIIFQAQKTSDDIRFYGPCFRDGTVSFNTFMGWHNVYKSELARFANQNRDQKYMAALRRLYS